MSAAEQARDLLDKIQVRHQCFDLLNEFFQRAHDEENLEQMRAIYEGMALLHSGKRP